MFGRFSAVRWLEGFEAAGGRFAIVGMGAFLIAPPTHTASALQTELLRKERRWIAVYQLAAAKGG